MAVGIKNVGNTGVGAKAVGDTREVDAASDGTVDSKAGHSAFNASSVTDASHPAKVAVATVNGNVSIDSTFETEAGVTLDGASGCVAATGT